MEELLVVLLQFLFEFALNVLANVPFDWPSRNRHTPEPDTIGLRCFLWFCGGCLLGGVSMLALKHTFISLAALRMLNLVIAPLTSACLSQRIAQRRARHNPNIVPRNHFWQAFWFTLGLVLVRFAYATRA